MNFYYGNKKKNRIACKKKNAGARPHSSGKNGYFLKRIYGMPFHRMYASTYPAHRIYYADIGIKHKLMEKCTCIFSNEAERYKKEER
jgi:hypothetical protein